MTIDRNIKDISSVIFIVIALFAVKISTSSPSPIENDEAKFMVRYIKSIVSHIEI